MTVVRTRQMIHGHVLNRSRPENARAIGADALVGEHDRELHVVGRAANQTAAAVEDPTDRGQCIGVLRHGLKLIGFSLHFLAKCTEKGQLLHFPIEITEKEGKTDLLLAGFEVVGVQPVELRLSRL